MEIRGDLNVGRLIEAGRRVNEAAVIKTDAALILDQWAEKILVMNPASVGTIDLPNTTDIPLGWRIVVAVKEDAFAVTVRTYHLTTPATLKQIIPGRTYEFMLIDKTSTAGVWMVNYLEEADLTPSERFVASFTAATSAGNWVNGTGYLTVTVEESVHGRGMFPMVQVFKDSSTDKIFVLPDQILVNGSGDIVIRVPSIGVPGGDGLKFAGSLVII